jgi:CO/xanthine dehydrogenase Mo-binding subunit
MLYGAFLFSDHTYADILNVDTSACSRAEGVQLVLTAQDIPGRNGFGLQIPHQQVFAGERARYPGEVIACVVADTEDAARAALGTVSVEYRRLDPLRDPVENMRSDAPLIHPDGNIAEQIGFTRGNPDAAFSEADLVVEGEYHVPPIEHAYLEPESCLAIPEEDGYTVTVYAATQGAFSFREMIAASLDLPVEQVRVVQTMPGGGFGGKEEPTVHIQAALAAVRTGRPVKITLNRSESIRISTKRHGAVIRMSHAVRSDGTLLGVRSRAVCDAGAYLSLTRPVVFRTVVCAAGPYAIPNVRAEGFGVYTTTNPAGAFRGFGSTQVAFAAERQMDKIARKLGIDPLELRRKNGLEAGRRTITGQLLRMDGTGYIATLDAVERALNEQRDVLMEAPLEPGWERAIGIASSYKNVGLGKGLPDTAGADVELTPDGTVLVRVGATDMGQGSDTVFAQIAARALGVPYDRVRVISSDTAQCPDGGMTTASRQTFVTGNAVRLAAEKLAARPPDAPLPARERVVYTAPETIPLAYNEGPGADGNVHFAFCYATHAVVVVVNRETGAVRVEHVIAAADAGTAIHLQNVKGQIEGGVVMGLGYGLSEQYIHEDDRIVTDTFVKLGVPRADVSPTIESNVIEIADRDGPYGAKGLGEVPLNPVAPAIANALASILGREIDSLPITPNAVTGLP